MSTPHTNGEFENPFNRKFNALSQSANAYHSEKLGEKASSIYADIPYEKEYKGVFVLSNFIALGASLVSFFTAFFAAKFVLSFILGHVIALMAALITCVSFELLKGFIWKTTAKNKLRYQKTSAGLILILVVLHGISLVTSCFGAYLLPVDVLPAQATSAPLTVLNSSEKAAQQVSNLDAQAAQIDAQINAFIPHLTKPNGKKSSSTAADIAALRAQKDAILAQKETATAAMITAAENEKTSGAQSEKAAAENRYFVQLLCIGIAVFFEAIYLFAVLFIFYYLFRVYVDKRASVPTAHQKESAHSENMSAMHSQKIALPTAHSPKQLPEKPAEKPAEPLRKIGFFLDASSECTTSAQLVHTDKNSNLDANVDANFGECADLENSEFSTYHVTFSNGVPVANVGGKLFTIDRVRSNYSAAKSKADKVKRVPNKHGERCEFWAKVLNDLLKLKS